MIKLLIELLVLITFVYSQGAPLIELPDNYNALIELQSQNPTVQVVNLVRGDHFVQWDLNNTTNCFSFNASDALVANDTIVSSALPIFQNLSSNLNTSSSGNNTIEQFGVTFQYVGKNLIRNISCDQYVINGTLFGCFYSQISPNCNFTFPVRLVLVSGAGNTTADYYLITPGCNSKNYLTQAGSIFSVPPFCPAESFGNFTIPQLPSSFHTVVSIVLPEKNLTRNADIFVDEATNRTMYSFHANGTYVSFISDRGNNTIYVNRTCTAQQLTLVQFLEQNNLNFSQSVISTLRNASFGNATYRGQELVDGIISDRWDIPYVTAVNETRNETRNETAVPVTEPTTSTTPAPTPETTSETTTTTTTAGPTTTTTTTTQSPTPAPSLASSLNVGGNETGPERHVLSVFFSVLNWTIDDAQLPQTPVLAILYSNTSSDPEAVLRMAEFGPFFDQISINLDDCNRSAQCPATHTPTETTTTTTQQPTTTTTTTTTPQRMALQEAMGVHMEQPAKAHMVNFMTLLLAFSIGIVATIAYNNAKRVHAFTWRKTGRH